MAIYAIAEVIDNIKGGNVIGLNLYDTENYRTMIVRTAAIIATLKNNPNKLANVKLINGKLEGTQGSLSKYPKLDASGALVSEFKVTILSLIYRDNILCGFSAVNALGGLSEYSIEDTVASGNMDFISNGKLKYVNGEYTIQSFGPKFDITYLKSNNSNNLLPHGFDRNNLNIIRNEIEQAVKGIEQKYDVAFQLGGITFSPERFTMRLEVIKTTPGKSADQVLFEKYCGIFGFMPSDFGKRFISVGKMFEICGISPKGRKYNILAKNIEDNRVYKFNARMVKNSLMEG